MNYLGQHYPDYDCDVYGNVFLKNEQIFPFKSNKYLQVLMFDKNRKRYVAGVHVIVAMKYLSYYPGCVVHHKDGNPQNNRLTNLEIKSRSTHSKEHMTGKHNGKGRMAWNKGIKMSKKFCEKCSISAKKRHDRERKNKEIKSNNIMV